MSRIGRLIERQASCSPGGTMIQSPSAAASTVSWREPDKGMIAAIDGEDIQNNIYTMIPSGGVVSLNRVIVAL